jgi:hypothetical protein
MGWQQRTAINRELAANYRQRQADITDLTQTGIQARTALEERGMQESGLGSRQQASFGHESGMQDKRQSFLSTEASKSRGFETAERLGKQGFLAKQAKEGDIRKYAGEGFLAGGDPETLGESFNAAEYGFADFGSTPIPQKSKSNAFSLSRGKVQKRMGPGGFVEETTPDIVLNQQSGELFTTGKQGLVPYTGGGTQVNDLDVDNLTAEDLATLSEDQINELIKRKKAEAVSY